MNQITVPAQIERVNEVFAFIAEKMTDAGMDIKIRNSVKIAVEEVFVNISSYAYPVEAGNVTVSAITESDKIIIRFQDSGTPYDPLAREDPDTTLSLDERDIGGLGVFMTKEIMDTVEYRYENGQNTLIISKNR